MGIMVDLPMNVK
jgi:hypothetical protein